MTPARENHVLSLLRLADGLEEFAGIVSGLRAQGELCGRVPLTIVEVQKRNGWKLYEPFPELNPMKGAA